MILCENPPVTPGAPLQTQMLPLAPTDQKESDWVPGCGGQCCAKHLVHLQNQAPRSSRRASPGKGRCERERDAVNLAARPHVPNTCLLTLQCWERWRGACESGFWVSLPLFLPPELSLSTQFKFIFLNWAAERISNS